jgi:hypothetical protein
LQLLAIPASLHAGILMVSNACWPWPALAWWQGLSFGSRFDKDFTQRTLLHSANCATLCFTAWWKLLLLLLLYVCFHCMPIPDMWFWAIPQLFKAASCGFRGLQPPLDTSLLCPKRSMGMPGCNAVWPIAARPFNVPGASP